MQPRTVSPCLPTYTVQDETHISFTACLTKKAWQIRQPACSKVIGSNHKEREHERFTVRIHSPESPGKFRYRILDSGLYRHNLIIERFIAAIEFIKLLFDLTPSRYSLPSFYLGS